MRSVRHPDSRPGRHARRMFPWLTASRATVCPPRRSWEQEAGRVFDVRHPEFESVAGRVRQAVHGGSRSHGGRRRWGMGDGYKYGPLYFPRLSCPILLSSSSSSSPLTPSRRPQHDSSVQHSACVPPLRALVLAVILLVVHTRYTTQHMTTWSEDAYGACLGDCMSCDAAY
ncbi:hypothetical protein OH76DRAFT_443528 [Lentinus brumalis]|uniref:Uncharacterized protein n=1 Tax=Lentinus brumalis TaxID=2498619 RepID=A0A371CIM4_9APHY|nr:hypothetical protein OH76DRAFT_443528 [Polyporus brumalis]